MSNMLTPREFGALIQHGHKTVRANIHSMDIYWNYQIIGMNIQCCQKFITDPCIFEVASFNDNGEDRWTVSATFRRAPNTPAHLFGRFVDDPMLVSMFAAMWTAEHLPRLIDGDDDMFTTDLLMLRMASELWT